jgi:hypothetical protein
MNVQTMAFLIIPCTFSAHLIWPECLYYIILYLLSLGASLKVPKREIFVTELFTLSDPIWIDDMRTDKKKTFV